jgi:hypothetical protein
LFRVHPENLIRFKINSLNDYYEFGIKIVNIINSDQNDKINNLINFLIKNNYLPKKYKNYINFTNELDNLVIRICNKIK